MKQKTCTHLQNYSLQTAQRYECAECIKTGDQWVHLRTCQTCGVTLCCDSSPNQHATKHFAAEGHPVVRSAEPGETWVYCYEDKLFNRGS